MKKGKSYLVEWFDAWGNGNYYKEGNDYTPVVICNIGFLCEENDETLVLSSSISEDDAQRSVFVVPWEYIIKVEELIL